MNKRHFLTRILTFPFKLLFSLTWYFCICLIANIKWIRYGGEEVIFFKKETKGQLLKLIEQNEELIRILKPKNGWN